MQGFGLPERRRQVLGIAEVVIIGGDFLELREIALPDGCVDSVGQLGGPKGASPFLLKAHTRDPVRERQECDRGQGKGNEESAESSLHHAAGPVAAQHHRGEVARNDKEEFHAPTVDEGPPGGQQDTFAPVLDDPVRPHVRQTRVQDDAREHREASKGVVVVPTFVG